jgi:predicted ChrR family anti-sigma factor
MNAHHSPEESSELVALYAVGALTHDERAAFEAHLETCEACRAGLQDLDRVVAALAGGVEPTALDPAIREALLARVAAGATRTGSPLRRNLAAEAPPAGPPAEVFIKRAWEGPWQATDVPGISIHVLSVDRAANHFTALVRMAPGASYPGHVHGGPEECLVLEGDLREGSRVMRPGDYERVVAGSRHDVQSTEQGCLLLITSSLSDEFA